MAKTISVTILTHNFTQILRLKCQINLKVIKYTIKMEIDISQLIERNPLTRLSRDYQNKFINRIKVSFSDNEQKMFVSSFYCYLNYNSKNDFVVDFDSVWKWLGFSRKSHCKTLLEKCFVENIDYKVSQDHTKDSFAAAAAKPLDIGGRPTNKILLTNILLKNW